MKHASQLRNFSLNDSAKENRRNERKTEKEKVIAKKLDNENLEIGSY